MSYLMKYNGSEISFCKVERSSDLEVILIKLHNARNRGCKIGPETKIRVGSIVRGKTNIPRSCLSKNGPWTVDGSDLKSNDYIINKRLKILISRKSAGKHIHWIRRCIEKIWNIVQNDILPNSLGVFKDLFNQWIDIANLNKLHVEAGIIRTDTVDGITRCGYIRAVAADLPACLVRRPNIFGAEFWVRDFDEWGELGDLSLGIFEAVPVHDDFPELVRIVRVVSKSLLGLDDINGIIGILRNVFVVDHLDHGRLSFRADAITHELVEELLGLFVVEEHVWTFVGVSAGIGLDVLADANVSGSSVVACFQREG